MTSGDGRTSVPLEFVRFQKDICSTFLGRSLSIRSIVSIEQMRAAIAKVYPGEKWSRQVANMPDNQVLVIYNRLLNAGKL